MKRPIGTPARRPRAALAQRDEQTRCLDMVRQGLSFRQIAVKLGCSVSTAYERYQAGRNQLPAEMAAEIAAEVLDRERAVIAKHWPMRHDPEHAKIIQAADKIIMGTVPARSEVTGKDGSPLMGEPAAKDDVIRALTALAAAACAGACDPEPNA